MNVVPPPEPTSGEGGVALSEYFTGYIGQIGTQFDGLGHQGGNIEYATAAGRLRMELRELADDEVYEFLFLTLPELIKGATGSMARPIAVR